MWAHVFVAINTSKCRSGERTAFHFPFACRSLSAYVVYSFIALSIAFSTRFACLSIFNKEQRTWTISIPLFVGTTLLSLPAINDNWRDSPRLVNNFARQNCSIEDKSFCLEKTNMTKFYSICSSAEFLTKFLFLAELDGARPGPFSTHRIRDWWMCLCCVTVNWCTVKSVGAHECPFECRHVSRVWRPCVHIHRIRR